MLPLPVTTKQMSGHNSKRSRGSDISRILSKNRDTKILGSVNRYIAVVAVVCMYFSVISCNVLTVLLSRRQVFDMLIQVLKHLE